MKKTDLTTVWLLFQTGTGNSSLHHRVQTASGVHPASYPIGTVGSFPVGKATGAWTGPLTTPPCAVIKMRGAIPPLSQYTFMAWRLVKSTETTLPLRYAMKTCGGGGIAPRILNLETKWRWVISFTLQPLYPGEIAHGTHWIGGPRAPETVWTRWRRENPYTDYRRCVMGYDTVTLHPTKPESFQCGVKTESRCLLCWRIVYRFELWTRLLTGRGNDPIAFVVVTFLARSVQRNFCGFRQCQGLLGTGSRVAELKINETRGSG
jgi:hypothetical protein